MAALWRSLKPKDRLGAIILSLMSLLFLIFVIGTGVEFWIGGSALASRGVPATAEVIDYGPRSQITFSWKVGSKQFEATDGAGRRGRFALGESIPIRYLPERPDKAHFDWVRLRQRGMGIVGVGTPLWILYNFLIIRTLGGSSKSRRKRAMAKAE